ncbi:hypothetical protein N7492_000181 [Penicillium capsulatum]|uniref:Uncharacterized protein n=1 Tax=Penicillium capsulatum TaxID=69766 RepID=A0A9W9IT20_9EURO|nr:hypothetical protein N7492_000181 [Penicillium capsulatum]KAJ6130754.1 hypothetical protein N7512_003534 [Penicillium capsulatum]
MGLMSSLSRCMRDNRISRRLSTSKQKAHRLDDDSNDLIKTTSNTLSLGRAESVSSSNTMVRDSEYRPVLPTESPQRKRLSPADLNLQTLFDNGHTLDKYASRAERAFSMPAYPVYKLDTTRSPKKTTTKKLQAPLETGNKRGSKRKTWDAKGENDPVADERGSGSKLRRSMTGLLKKSYSFRTSHSMKRRSSCAAPKCDDDSSIPEENRLHVTAEQKWLEANGLTNMTRDYSWAKSVGMW